MVQLIVVKIQIKQGVGGPLAGFEVFDTDVIQKRYLMFSNQEYQ